MLKPTPESRTSLFDVSQVWQKSRPMFIVVAIAASVVILGAATWSLISGGESQDLFVYYTVAKTDLPIVVTERGNLESQMETTITCNVENISVDRSGNYGTQIIQIVPNGAPVEEGELLVELDSAAIRDRLDTQVLDYQRAVSAKTQAISLHDNQIIQNETTLAEAELAIKLAKLELEMYMDEENGTFQLSVEEVERLIDDAKNLSLEARASLQLARVEKVGMEELFTLGYRGKNDLEQSRLKFIESEDRLSSALNKVKTHQANRRKLTDYDFKMQKLTLEGALATAERGRRQVENDNASLLEQALAAKDEALKTELKEKERLDRLEQQLVRCKIYAPHSGMAVYVRDRRSSTEIGEGATVRERQRILTLPDLSRMQVKSQVHEAVLDQVRPGLRASVRVDAFPGTVYPAIVEKVAVVPSSNGWSSGSVKTYDTIVKIEQEVDNLKPGMTAVVDIHVDRIPDVFAVPVQAVVQVDRDNWCYVQSSRGVERRDIKLGRSNAKFVHIQEGLNAGDRVVLNPMDVIDERQRKEEVISPDAGVPELPESAEKLVQTSDWSVEEKARNDDGMTGTKKTANASRRNKGSRSGQNEAG